MFLGAPQVTGREMPFTAWALSEAGQSPPGPNHGIVRFDKHTRLPEVVPVVPRCVQVRQPDATVLAGRS